MKRKEEPKQCSKQVTYNLAKLVGLFREAAGDDIVQLPSGCHLSESVEHRVDQPPTPAIVELAFNK